MMPPESLKSCSPDCPSHIGAKKVDTLAWEKICHAVDKPEYLLGQARNLVEELRASSVNLHEEQARIEKQLEGLMTERQ